jgi:hypothetical protein
MGGKEWSELAPFLVNAVIDQFVEARSDEDEVPLGPVTREGGIAHHRVGIGLDLDGMRPSEAAIAARRL